MKRTLGIISIFLLFFYSLPLYYYKNYLPSHDERFIINLTFSLPLNNFLPPVYYYGPIQLYFLLISYSPLVIFGYIFKNNGIDYVKHLFVNDFQILTLIGKLTSLLFFVIALFIIFFIAKEKKWKPITLLFLILSFFFLHPLYISMTTIKNEALLFFLIFLFIYINIKLKNTHNINYLYFLAIISAALFIAKYNMIILLIFPIITFLPISKIKKKFITNFFKFLMFFLLFTILFMPAFLFDFRRFFEDFIYIFKIVNIEHIGWQQTTKLSESIYLTLNLFFANLPITFIFLLPCIFIYEIIIKKNTIILSYYATLIIYCIFLLKWKYRLPHYVIPIIPFILIIIFDFINNLENKLILIFIAITLISSFSAFRKNLNYIQSLKFKDIRILAKEYIENTIPENSRILLEDRFDYSPYILPSAAPQEYDAINPAREKIKQKYFELLIQYGAGKKYNIIFINVPLEGQRLLTFKFPTLEYLQNNCDYIVINEAYSYRFRDSKDSKNNFMNDAYKFYFETLKNFEIISELKNSTGTIKIYKTRK